MTPEKLLQSLTLDQKLAQLVASGMPAELVKDGKFDRDRAAELYPHGVGGLLVPQHLSAEATGAWYNDMRAYFDEVCPVPPVIICESLHGVLGKCATVFPQSIGMGATFDPALMRRVAEVIGEEARALGVRMSFAPDLDLGRDPRWGRQEETFGEDSLLVGAMGEAYVKGIRGDGNWAATLKHFAVHGNPQAGINMGPTIATEQELRDRYLPPFRRALDAGAKCVMPAYSTLNGIPCHTHRFLLQRVLRREWQFTGPVVSDFGAIEMLHTYHATAADLQEAGLQAITAGVDIEGPAATCYGDKLKPLLKDGRLDMAVVDLAVLRILRMKQEIGLFDQPPCDAEAIAAAVHTKKHLDLAREAARKSMVLLKNDGALPLRPKKKLAVIGPNAFSVQLGDYALPRPDAPTPAQALAERAAKDGVEVVTTRGCATYGHDTSGFDEAVALTRESDAAVLVIGGRSMKGYGVAGAGSDEPILSCGENCDMHDLTPGGPQLDLARAMIATGTPVVIVMIDGRAETLRDVADGCAALVAAWYPGEEGSRALADLLFGDANFSGRLPVTFPAHTGQLPLTYDRAVSARGYERRPGTPDKPGLDYVFGSTDPAFEFGFGLNYSEIAYSGLSVERAAEGLTVRVTVTNRGDYAADEAVLVFLRDEVASLSQPMKKLAAFTRVWLAPGDTRSVAVEVPESALMFTNEDMRRVLEPGWFSVYVDKLTARISIR